MTLIDGELVAELAEMDKAYYYYGVAKGELNSFEALEIVLHHVEKLQKRLAQ